MVFSDFENQTKQNAVLSFRNNSAILFLTCFLLLGSCSFFVSTYFPHFYFFHCFIFLRNIRNNFYKNTILLFVIFYFYYSFFLFFSYFFVFFASRTRWRSRLLASSLTVLTLSICFCFSKVGDGDLELLLKRGLSLVDDFEPDV